MLPQNNNHEQYQVAPATQHIFTGEPRTLQQTLPNPAEHIIHQNREYGHQQSLAQQIQHFQETQIKREPARVDSAGNNHVEQISLQQQLQINNHANNHKIPLFQGGNINGLSPAKLILKQMPRDRLKFQGQGTTRRLSHSQVREQTFFFNQQQHQSPNRQYFNQPTSPDALNALVLKQKASLLGVGGHTLTPQGFHIRPQLTQGLSNEGIAQPASYHQPPHPIAGPLNFSQNQHAPPMVTSAQFNMQLMAFANNTEIGNAQQQLQKAMSRMNSNLPNGAANFTQSGVYNAFAQSGPRFSTMNFNRLEERKEGLHPNSLAHRFQNNEQNANLEPFSRREQTQMQKASALEFERYLGLVFSDLCARDNGLEKKTINFDTFNAYLRSASISLVLARRLFVAIYFDPANENQRQVGEQKSDKNISNIEILRLRINEASFVRTLLIVFNGTHQQQKELLLKMLDFTGSGGITRQDLGTFLFHVLSTKKPRHVGYKEILKDYLHVLVGKLHKIPGRTNSSGGNLNNSRGNSYGQAQNLSKLNFHQIKESNQDLEDASNAEQEQSREQICGQASLSYGGMVNVNSSIPREEQAKSHGISICEPSPPQPEKIESPNLKIKQDVIDALLDATFCRLPNGEIDPNSVLAGEQFIGGQRPSSTSPPPSDNTGIVGANRSVRGGAQDNSLRAYVHLTRIIMDYLRLLLPCGWQYQRHFDEAFTHQQLLIKQQSVMLIQKNSIHPFSNQLQPRHHSNKALNSATSLTNQPQVAIQTKNTPVTPTQHTVQADQLSVKLALPKAAVSSNSCSLTPPAAGGSSSPTSNVDTLNFHEAQKKIMEINQQIKQIESASKNHAQFFHSQSNTPVNKGIKLTHHFPVSKASNNKLGKTMFNELVNELEGKREDASVKVELRKGGRLEDEDGDWEIGPGRNQQALKLNPSKFSRNVSPHSNSGHQAKPHEALQVKSRFAKDSRNGKFELPQLNENDLNEDESIMSSKGGAVGSQVAMSGPVRIKFGAAFSKMRFLQNGEEQQSIGTPTSRFGNQLKLNLPNEPRARSPISQRINQPDLTRKSDMSVSSNKKAGGRAQDRIENKDPILPGRKVLLLEVQGAHDLASSGDNADGIHNDDEDNALIEKPLLLPKPGNTESWEDALGEAMDEGIHFSESDSADDDYDVGDDENVSQVKAARNQHQTFNVTPSVQNLAAEEVKTVHEPKQKSVKSNFGKFRRGDQGSETPQEKTKLHTLPLEGGAGWAHPNQYNDLHIRTNSQRIEVYRTQMPLVSPSNQVEGIYSQKMMLPAPQFMARPSATQQQDATLRSNNQAHALRNLREQQVSNQGFPSQLMVSHTVIDTGSFISPNMLDASQSRNYLHNQYSGEDVLQRSRSREHPSKMHLGLQKFASGDRNLDILPLKLNKSRAFTPAGAYLYKKTNGQGDDENEGAQNAGYVTPGGTVPFNILPAQYSQQEAQNNLLNRIQSRLSVEYKRVPSYSPIRGGYGALDMSRNQAWGAGGNLVDHKTCNNQQLLGITNKKSTLLERINSPNECPPELQPLDLESELLLTYDQILYNTIVNKKLEKCPIQVGDEEKDISPKIGGLNKKAFVSPTLGQDPSTQSRTHECFLLGPQSEYIKFYCKIQGPDLIVAKDPQCENIKFLHCLMNSEFYLLENLETPVMATTESEPKYKLKIKISFEHKRVLHFMQRQSCLELLSNLESVRFHFTQASRMQDVVGRYPMAGLEQECLLGQGSYGKVYRAIDTQQGGEGIKQVAIKKIFKARMQPAELELIYEEIEICRTLAEEGHPQIAHLIDVSEDDDMVVIIIELVQGINMFKWTLTHLKDTGHEEREIQGVFRQAASALAYVHERGIVHRDIKLDNLLIYRKEDSLDSPWGVKLIDFGLSTTLLSGQRVTEVVGSVAYLSPEIISKQPHDRSTDVWSMGIVLYILLTGRMPFVDKEVERTKANIVGKDLDFAKASWERVSQEAISLVKAMLEKDPTKRIKAGDLHRHEWLKEPAERPAVEENKN